jgi:hypothetical protein
VTASGPIPLDAFVTELESLDSDAFATLVGETYAATADGVDVDAPHVTVSEGDRRTDLFVCSVADRGVPDDSVDAVVVANDALVDDLDPELDADVVTPTDLRERLLYAVPPAEATAITDRHLGVPVRSEAYERATGSDAEVADSEAGDDDGGGVTDGDGSDDDGPTDAEGATDDAATAAVPAGAAGSRVASSSPPTDRTGTDSADASLSHDEPNESADSDSPSDREFPRTVVVAVAVAVLLVSAAGIGFAAGAAGVGGFDGVAGVGSDGTTDPAATDSDPTGSTNGSDDGSEASTEDGDAGNTVSVADGDPTSEAERNTALAPTCERSALQVVQIQMNALRYTDNETNDGIRTLRAFASPENREVVGSTDEYAELFETAQYGPMLTYDTAEYSVPVIDGETAEVEVVTRENGSVTGRYEFRLVRVDGGTGESDGSPDDVDDCWMTDAVAASSE